jgi:AcrR family transcriptional regulator
LARVDIKAKVLQAARPVFARKGYRGATVSDILAEARISRGTFYKYFPNKRQVLFEIVSGIFRTLFESSQDMMSAEDPSLLTVTMRDSLELSYRLFLDNRGVIVVYFREAFRSDPGFYAIWDDFERRMLALFSDVLSRGRQAGVFREVDANLISRAMFMLFMQVPYWDLLLGGMAEIDLGAMADEIVAFVISGISAAASTDQATDLGGVFDGGLD